MDEMARITGVGAKKLESFGAEFLSVIAGAAEPLHPQRMRLAGRAEAEVFDRLQEAQLELLRGEDGAGKYLTCTHATLRIIAERRPGSLAELERVQGMGPQKAERFGAAFLEILRET
jgi:ATP-dependent DNA helicase RecQ